MIAIENLSKGYGGRILLDEVSVRLNRRERVGLVARNGHGKTTLLRLIAGEEKPDSGTIIVPRGYRIGYVRQHLDFTMPTLAGEACRGLPPDEQHQQWRAEKILAGLGFSQADMERPPQEFSGGYQVRLNLARALVAEPDLLLLDEPTNYLDIVSIRWVERFLQQWPHELILITHDRSFMDAVVTHTMGIHRCCLRKIAGTTDAYYNRIAHEEAVHEKTRLNDERRRREVELFISRFRAKARLANLVQSRVKLLEKQEKTDRLEKIEDLEFSFRSSAFAARTMLTAADIGFSYDPAAPLISDFSLIVGRRDRIAIIGKNGRGKTTLLKLLAGTLAPDSGTRTSHPATCAGVFEQTNLETLVPERTVEEEILYSDPCVDNQLARDICGAMMFEGDAALKPVRVLSGGEKSRVLLGKLLVTPVNLLLLDEPTNHLDMASCDALLTALDSFDGALVMVTHNELFLHALATRLVVFSGTGPQVFEGTYQDFLDRGGWQEEEGDIVPRRAVPAQARASRRDLRRRRSEIITERSRVIGPLEQRMQALERDIEEHERSLQEHTGAMQTASQTGDGERIAELGRQIGQCQHMIDTRYDELEACTREHEHHSAAFEARLRELDADEAC